VKRLVVIGMALVAIVATVAAGIALTGGDDEARTTNPSSSEAPSGEPAPPTPGGLPPEFVACMAEQGFEIESQADVHSAPPQVLQACFGSFHGRGAAP
jgi:hypothetical protein